MYLCKTLGINIPLSVWKFSIIEAKTLGNAKELPFNVWARFVLPFTSLYLSFNLLAWKDSKLDTDETSNHLSWAGEYISKSYVKADVKPKSPPHRESILNGNSKFWRF